MHAELKEYPHVRFTWVPIQEGALSFDFCLESGPTHRIRPFDGFILILVAV
jgi:hypothetical protein